MIRVIDRLWLREGLDLSMVSFKVHYCTSLESAGSVTALKVFPSSVFQLGGGLGLLSLWKILKPLERSRPLQLASRALSRQGS